jgi:hypothetical protein
VLRMLERIGSVENIPSFIAGDISCMPYVYVLLQTSSVLRMLVRISSGQDTLSSVVSDAWVIFYDICV